MTSAHHRRNAPCDHAAIVSSAARHRRPRLSVGAPILVAIVVLAASSPRLHADPLDGSSLVFEIRHTPVFAYKDGTGRQFGAEALVYAGTADIAAGSMTSANLGAVAPAPSTSLGNDIFVKAEAGSAGITGDPSIHQLVVQLEGAVTAGPGGGVGGLHDVGMRIVDLIAAQSPPAGKIYWSSSITLELLSVDFPSSSWVEFMTSSKTQLYAGLPVHDPSTGTLPSSSSAWWNITDLQGLLPWATGGSSPCPDPDATRFSFRFETVFFPQEIVESAALRWVIFYRENVWPVAICWLNLVLELQQFIFQLHFADKIPDEGATMLLREIDEMEEIVDALNGAGDTKTAEALFDELGAKLDALDRAADDLRRQLADRDYLTMKALVDHAKSEYFAAFERAGASTK